MGKLIKFDHVNAHGDFPAVLTHLGLDYTRKGDQLRLLCPFHDDAKPSLNITLVDTGSAQANTFHCFGCHESGSLIDFVAGVQGGDDLRAAAELIASVSNCGLAPPRTEKRAGKAKSAIRARGRKSPPEARSDDPVKESGSSRETAVTGESEGKSEATETNPVLKFAFTLEPEHPYLATRVSAETVREFGLGFLPQTSRSIMAGRICIPVHNATGGLIAYAGRWPAPEPPDRDTPKYLLPKAFEKMQALYNLHRLEPGVKWAIVVEGFFGAMRLRQLGLPVVAVMGTAVSERQAALLANAGIKHLILMFDGDPPGREATGAAVSLLTRSFFVKSVTLPDGGEPDTIDEAALFDLLGLKPGARRER